LNASNSECEIAEGEQIVEACAIVLQVWITHWPIRERIESAMDMSFGKKKFAAWLPLCFIKAECLEVMTNPSNSQILLAFRLQNSPQSSGNPFLLLRPVSLLKVLGHLPNSPITFSTCSHYLPAHPIVIPQNK
jgi:hypothetical protein